MELNRIKEIRKSKGITQQELADKIGISQGHVARLESGASEMTISQISQFAKALGVEPWEILPMSMQPKINLKDLELLKLLKSLTTPVNSTGETKVG